MHCVSDELNHASMIEASASGGDKLRATGWPISKRSWLQSGQTHRF
jgi:hypothetical protein